MATLPYTLTNGTTADADHVMGNLNAINNDYPNQVGYAAAMGLQEGVYASGDLMVTQRGAGVNMSVDVAAGHVAVQDDASTQGLLAIVYKSAVTNVAISAADATNPRIDQIVVSKAGVVSAVTGTATVGATLDNRSGAAALPSNCLRLADVLVPAASVALANTSIRDRRPWARGAYHRILRNAGTTYTITGAAALADIDATNLKPRIECSGAPMRATLRGTISHNTAARYVTYAPAIDGAVPDTGMTEGGGGRIYIATGGISSGFSLAYDFIPTAGTHRISWLWAMSDTGIATMNQSPGIPLQMTVEELPRQNIANNSVTSG